MPAPTSRLVLATAMLLALGAAPALGDATGTGTATTADFGQPRTDPSPRHPRVLPRELHGRAAIAALDTDLPAVAARNDLSGPRLKKILTEDPSARISEEGQLLYREQMSASAVTTGALSGGSTTPAYSTSRTFTLHSRPGATKQIFLDFDGAEVAGTGWNEGSVPMPAQAYTGYDSDGNVGSYSSAEHAWMQEVWRQIAETYSSLDVDVTTEDEGADARTRSSSSDTTYGTQVVFTNSTTAVKAACDSQCLGVAYVGTFDSVDPTGYYQPAWVFTTTTMSPTIASQGGSHEAGHTLGLHHDGTSTAPYYAGTAAWGPIMGSARSRAVSQFSIGEYADANNKEDDFSVIKANGLNPRADDHGNTTATADPLGAQASYAATGVIGTRTDTDLFAIDVQCSTDLTASVTGIGPQTAVDLKLEVLDSSGAPVASSSPASGYSGSPPVSTGMNASVKVPAALGTYYLRVDGVGNGDPGGTGWSDYGSLGQYSLSANGCTSPTQPPSDTSTQGPVTRPTAPRIGTASSGVSGGKVTAAARWWAPTSDGGTPITKYRVLAKRLSSAGAVIATYASAFQGPSVRKVTMTLPKARYTFVVVAWNKVGASPYSKYSNIVHAR